MTIRTLETRLAAEMLHLESFRRRLIRRQPQQLLEQEGGGNGSDGDNSGNGDNGGNGGNGGNGDNGGNGGGDGGRDGRRRRRRSGGAGPGTTAGPAGLVGPVATARARANSATDARGRAAGADLVGSVILSVQCFARYHFVIYRDDQHCSHGTLSDLNNY